MKKMLLGMAAVAMVATSVQAQSETVTSVNVVGYYSVTIPRGQTALLTPVLESFEIGTVPDLVGDQLPPGSSAFVWNRTLEPRRYSSLDYSTPPRGGEATWAGATDLVLLRGDAFWLKVPASAPEEEYTVTFFGEVPADNNAASTTTIYNIAGRDIVAYAYPVDVVFTNTSLASDINIKEIWMWDERPAPDGQRYINYYRETERGGGQDGPWVGASPVIPAGRAFWVRSTDIVDWTEVAPYRENL